LNPWLKMIVHHEDWNFDKFCPSELWPIHTHPMFLSWLICCVYSLRIHSQIKTRPAVYSWPSLAPNSSDQVIRVTSMVDVWRNWRDMKKIRNVLWIYDIEPPKR
jgi:hypothetical protein